MDLGPGEGSRGNTDHRLVADGTPDLQTIVAVDGVYRFVSATGAKAFGWTPSAMIGQPHTSFIHADDVALLVDTHRGLLAGGAGSATAVHRFRCRDGTFRWVESRWRVDTSGDEPVAVASVRDIADRHRSELDLQRRAATDPLTGVANRAVFMDRLRHALHRLDRHDGLVAVLFLDLDRFKIINDSLGHHAGDAVLLQMAQRLLQVLRPQDTLARLGGDEFAVVAEDLSSVDDAVVLGERIIETGRRPFEVGEERFVCTTSAGIAVTTDANHGAEGLLHAADLALYRAKEHGRDRSEVFDDALRTRAVGRLATERMLRHAIADERLQVDYQPIVDLRTGATVSAEALVRVWDADRSELVAAQAFIEVAEETGLLTTIDDWVLRRVIDQAGAWRRDVADPAFGDVAINVSARRISDAGFAQSVIDGLAEHDLAPDALQIELTEHVLMEASKSTIGGLETLRAVGVKVGLDNFGSGFSSLSYLRVLPLDFVKIDQSLVHELTSGGTGPAIVASIVALSHALGMTVAAQGVESQAQLDHLVAIGCDRAQGFHFAPPSNARLVEQKLLDAVRLRRGRTEHSGDTGVVA